MEYIRKIYRKGLLSETEYADCKDYAIWVYKTEKEYRYKKNH